MPSSATPLAFIGEDIGFFDFPTMDDGNTGITIGGDVIAAFTNDSDVAAFMEYMISPEAGQFFITQFGYGHGNRKAFDLVDEESLASVGLPRDPTALLSAGVFSGENKRQAEVTQMFENVMAGI